MSSFFHAYDLRGKFPDEIGEEEAERVGKAYGTFTDAEEVLVGRDGRTHGDIVMESFIEGILSTGTDVLDADMVPTPVVYQAMRERGIESAAIVTASHNPPEYTGFKFCRKDALAMSREGGMKEIQDLYELGMFDEGDGSAQDIEVEQDYIDAVVSVFDRLDLDVAVNFGNGVAAGIGREMLEDIGCSVNSINDTIDGEFPNHLPDPTNDDAKKALREEMEGEDLGIIFDGDGDRAGFIVPGYGYLEEDKVIALFSERCLREGKGKVVHDLRASKLVPERIREAGGEPVETRVGHTFISEEIHSDPGIVFAGELSGHYYFPVFGFPFDDGLFAAALMAEIAADGGLKERIEGYPDYPVSPELRIDCPEEAKQEVVKSMKESYLDHEVSTIDGAKIHFDDGWALVRPSNTEEKMSVRCEGDTEEAVDRILDEVESEVRKIIDQES